MKQRGTISHMVKNSNGNKKYKLFKKPEMMEPDDLEKLMEGMIADTPSSENSDAGFEDVVESFNEIKQDLKAEEPLNLKKDKKKHKNNKENPKRSEKPEEKTPESEKKTVSENQEKDSGVEKQEPEKKSAERTDVEKQEPQQPQQEKVTESQKQENEPLEEEAGQKQESEPLEEEAGQKQESEPLEEEAEQKQESEPLEEEAEQKHENEESDSKADLTKNESEVQEDVFEIHVPENAEESIPKEPEVENFDEGGLEEKIEAATAALLGISGEGSKTETQQKAPENKKPEEESKKESKKSEKKAKKDKKLNEGKQEQEEEYPDDVPKHRGVWKKVIGFILSLVVIASAAFAYLLVADYFTEHFYRGTTINGKDCTYLTAKQVKDYLQSEVNKYHMDIETLEGETYTLKASQIDMLYADDKQIDKILHEQEPFKWIMYVFSSSNQVVPVESEYNNEKIKEVINEMPFMQEENITKPADAYMQESEGEYVVIPEVEGNQPDMEKVMKLAEETVQARGEKMSLVDGDCYVHPAVRKEDAALNGQAQSLNQLTASVLTYQVSGETYTLDRSTLKDWVIQDEQGNYSLDVNKMTEYINMLADKRDTYGGTRQFVTTGGNEITLEQNYYGWKVNREKSIEELKAALQEGRQGEMELIYSHRAQGEGANDLGSVYVEISIDQQRMWCYKDGQVVVDTPVVSGNLSIPGRATPRNGCWQIFRKNTEYTMRGPIQANGRPEYTAFVHYWMPFNGGVGIHDLASRGNNFGGEIYKTRGSHGCINTPLDAVRAIYNTVSVGTPVIVY